jgi:hypothetical protein
MSTKKARANLGHWIIDGGNNEKWLTETCAADLRRTSRCS